jgi:nucleotide-binding universal stress UspA family protein
MGSGVVLSINDALDDFYQSRRRATLQEILASLKGEEISLLSFDEIREKLKIHGSLARGKKEIPLDSIIGSVNRYEDFTRGFLPKSSVNPQRWANVELIAAGMVGLPPIEVYQIGEVYFVIDGNHRVSIARHFGAKTILAYVHEVPTRISIGPDDDLEDILHKADYEEFLEKTRINELRPEADLYLTVPGQYHLLKEHIDVHHYYLGIQSKKEIEYSVAVTSWYDNVYLPVIYIIREQGLTKEFPSKTEADLYLWVAEHRSALEANLQNPIKTVDALYDFADQYSPTLSRKSKRIRERIKERIIPEKLESGPPVGEWRQRVQIRKQDLGLFRDILICINGRETGWIALDESLLISKRENSNVLGLHIVKNQAGLDSSATKSIIAEFTKRCKQTGKDTNFVVDIGKVTTNIINRSRWSDLVVLNLDFPPPQKRIGKISSGFREIVMRCPRPILVVPHTFSPLSSVLLAYNDSPKAQEALFVATILCLSWKIPITVVNITETDKTSPGSLENASKYLTAHGVNAKFLEIAEPISTSLLITVEEEGCDLIVMGGYGQKPLANFLIDNVVDQVMRSSRIPMLLCR